MKEKKHPLEEGSARTIWDKFISPLIRYKHEDQSIRQWLDKVFHVDERPINRYKCHKPFSMPGLYHIAPLTKVQGIGPRHVNVDDIIWARLDSKFPNVIEIEIERETRAHLFTLDSSQWNWIQLFLNKEERHRWSP